MMKCVYDLEKNEKLKKTRGVCFDDVILAIETGRFLDMTPHHAENKYPNQSVLVIEIDDYAYLVPCLVEGDTLVLKTVYPSRKATAMYLRSKHKEVKEL